MNNHNLKRRRPYGHEGVPAVQAVQDPLSSPSTAETSPYAFSEHELQILREASSILHCPLPQLLSLYKRPCPPNLREYSTSYTSNKKLRLDTDVVNMSSHLEKTPAGDANGPNLQHRPRHPDAAPAGLSRLATYLVHFPLCSPCTTCEPQAYPTVPTTASYSYNETRPFLDHKPASPPTLSTNVTRDSPDVFTCDNAGAPVPMMPNYPALQPSQPMAIQPTSSGEGMVYPDGVTSHHGYLVQHQPQPPEIQHGCKTTITTPTTASGNQASNQVMGAQMYNTSPSEGPGDPRGQYDAVKGVLASEKLGPQIAGQAHDLDIVHANQRPPPARRGPFRSSDDREKTAETRRIGSCIRCRMQRIRCETNPDDKHGSCLTCQRVSNVKVWRMPCLRYKITDVKLFKPGQVKGLEWTRRWVEGVADDISQWESMETKEVKVTEGYTSKPIGLRVRQFTPQEGDKLVRTWVHEGIERGVKIPAYAIVNLEEAKDAYSNYISRGFFECCKTILAGKDRLLFATYVAALKAIGDPGIDEKEKDLLKKALQLWMAVRLTTKSTIIVGDETLGMSRDIMDATSPLHGCIPLPPVMGAQIELVLIHQIQSNLRREMLENLQTMTQANKHQTWFTTYLVTFILLHNVALLCQHDAGYARKHGMKSRFAREDMVREYQMGANILLAYFHYCNKGIYPFSAECKEQDLSSLAGLDEPKANFIRLTRGHVEKHKESWAKVRRSNDYENDFFYISQLFEENWLPQAPI
ncbi:hypothetical protein F4780DRAFT_769901 [Xylariomycetidae sp. FL0641]|nr:hypothetical protein F4780DRAFT_769901 [Xylariomycetidae sp. FL0641]